MSKISRQLFIDKVAAVPSLSGLLVDGKLGLTGGLMLGAVPVVYHRLRGEKVDTGTSALTSAGMIAASNPLTIVHNALVAGNPEWLKSIPNSTARGLVPGLMALPTAYLSAYAANAIADRLGK